MAGEYRCSGSSRGELQVSRCFCETGRERYRLSQKTRIPWEHTIPEIPETPAVPAAAGNDNDNVLLDDEGPVLAALNMQDIGVQANFDDVEFDVVSEMDEESDDDHDDEDTASQHSDSSEDSRMPSISRWRLNLTALSQVYNLYFVVFGSRIHISRPRSCVTHKLPSVPDLVLKPEASASSRHVGGYIDVTSPHQVNQIIVADFGDHEILLLAYDDGDVIGYYTKHIEDEIVRREQIPPLTSRAQDLKPFFHENVGQTAWGLAVHKQSRLIAVGSNSHHASVFIPALTGKSIEGQQYSYRFYRTFKKHASGRVHGMESSFECDRLRLEGDVKSRETNCCVILETDISSGNNLPNLTFSDDETGEADKVVAVDISGNLWLMDIWNFRGQRHLRIPSLHRQRSQQMPRELISPWARARVRPATQSMLSDRQKMIESEYWFDAYRTPSGMWSPVPSNARSASPTPMEQDSKLVLRDGSSIIRLYENDIELRGFEEDGVGIMYQHATRQIRHPTRMLGGLQDIDASQDRLSNNLYVPELSLVIAASMAGRVALITLTRPKVKGLGFKRGFKVEAILPTKSDEEQRLRPMCPLYGVAIGPVALSGVTGQWRPASARPRRYRLMIHYYDLRILSYEISRDSATDSLSII